MKLSIVLFALTLSTSIGFGQSVPQEYSDLVRRADSMRNAKDYKNAALTYSKAFNVQGLNNILTNDVYHSAGSWAQANYPDSAFFQLNRIAKIHCANHETMDTDADLLSLHSDPRWISLKETINQNKNGSEKKFNRPLMAMLDTIHTDDKIYREQLAGISEKYGQESKETQEHLKLINEKDSINLFKMKSILDTYGWVGADVVGTKGMTTIFLIIQRADQATQEKYLPMMREAFKNGKARGSSLAILEDRVALGQGKRQIYGSQVCKDMGTNQMYVSPIEDPDGVDQRRAAVDLPPMAEYLNNWQMTWDLERYKKDLPALEERLKNQ